MKKSQILCAIGITTLLAVGCSKQDHLANSEGDIRRAGIIHGMEIPNSVHPETVKITAGGGMCTGVFIDDNPPTLLTASHCLLSLPTATSNSGGVKYGTAKSRRACIPKGAIGHVNPYDLAIVVFENGAFQVPGLATITTTEPAPGTAVTLVGFGRNTGVEGAIVSGAGKKRLGLNTVKRIVSGTPKNLVGMIEVNGAVEGDLPEADINNKQDSSPNHGDSGGPMFLSSGRGTEIVGLVSGGHVEKGVSIAYYTSLAMKDNNAFLMRALSPEFLDSLQKEELPKNYSDVCEVTK